MTTPEAPRPTIIYSEKCKAHIAIIENDARTPKLEVDGQPVAIFRKFEVEYLKTLKTKELREKVQRRLNIQTGNVRREPPPRQARQPARSWAPETPCDTDTGEVLDDLPPVIESDLPLVDGDRHEMLTAGALVAEIAHLFAGQRVPPAPDSTAHIAPPPPRKP